MSLGTKRADKSDLARNRQPRIIEIGAIRVVHYGTEDAYHKTLKRLQTERRVNLTEDERSPLRKQWQPTAEQVTIAAEVYAHSKANGVCRDEMLLRIADKCDCMPYAAKKLAKIAKMKVTK